MMLGAVKDAREKYGKGKDRRDVMIHCQTVREDQLDAMKEYGGYPVDVWNALFLLGGLASRFGARGGTGRANQSQLDRRSAGE